MRAPDLTGNGGEFETAASAANGSNRRQNTTGRHTIVFRKGATTEGIEFLRQAGFNVFVSNASDPEVVREDQVGEANVIVFSTLGVAVVGGEPDQISRLQNVAAGSTNPILAIKPEKVRRMIQDTSTGTPTSEPDGVMVSLSYLRGWRDASDELMGKFVANGGAGSQPSAADAVPGFNESQSTWGLQATKVVDSPFSGRGVKVAVLDTGIDFRVDDVGNIRYHPDFEGRTIFTASFVRNVPSAKDGDGHGTHCVGTACGPRRPTTLPGYGIASDAEIYVGKVLDDAGSGADAWILAGIEWAINQGCRVISMSLGGPKEPGDAFNEAYEEVAQRALEAGTIIVAAAGNRSARSARPTRVRPVDGPADCPSIIAVAAVDQQLQVAEFSNGGINLSGGEVNIAAPGVDIYSSYKSARRERLEGTSMATPHVAGIAALFAEANPTASARELKDLLTSAVQQLSLNAQDVGKGLVQAPENGQVKREVRSRVAEQYEPPYEGGIVTKQQTSPITIGGGGSVGIGFDLSHYVRQPAAPGQSTKFENQVNDQLEKLRIIDKYGAAPDRTPPTVECRIVVHCEDFDAQGNVKPNSDSPVTIYGNPLSVEVKVEDYSFGKPPGGNRDMFFSLTRKITGTVDIFEGAATSPTIQYPVPTGGKCTVDVLNRL